MDSRNLKLETGQLCLDFANTADWHGSAQPTELLNSYADLVAWAQKVGLFTAREGQQLLQQAAQRATETATILGQAIDFREAIYRIFSATNDGRQPAEADLAELNRRLARALSQVRVSHGEDGFSWEWVWDGGALDQMLWPVARSAADLLTSNELGRVKECEDDRGCGFLFFDTSRNQSRRWCVMRGCGNRAKVRRYRKRQDKEA